jgi:hypothetical protein
MTMPVTASSAHITGKIIDVVSKVSIDPTRPLPLACALYEVENSEGIWLCAYYGSNRSVFDFLPARDQEIDEEKLGIPFLHKTFIPKAQFQASDWEEFKKTHFMVYGG